MESAVSNEQAPAGVAERVRDRRRHRHRVRGVICATALTIAAVSAAIPLGRMLLPGGEPSSLSADDPGLAEGILQPAKPIRLRPGESAGPLYDAAAALSAAGQEPRFAALYATDVEDPPHRVLLWLTDPAQASILEAAARERDPALAPGMITVFRSRYSLVQLSSAARRLLTAGIAGHLPFEIYAAGYMGLQQAPGGGLEAGPMGDSLEVEVPNPAADERLAGERLAALGGRTVRQLAGVPLTFLKGAPLNPLVGH